ncbi:MAG: HAMP domain-containing protein, partial [Proteobacteria bacterium]|nr:HAMP domain-containing protein [Pseudomonadota bacterium]
MRKNRFIRWRPGLRFILTTLCLLGMVGASGLISYKSLRTLYETSIRDAWTILFLDLEVQSANLTEQILAQAELTQVSQPVAAFQIVDQLKIKWKNGRWNYIDNLGQFGLDDGVLVDSNIKHLVTEIAGEVLLVSKERIGSGIELHVRPIPSSDWGKIFKRSEEDTLIYIANRSGRLLFSNSNYVSPDQVAIRPLVTAFIKAPFRQGQLEFQVAGESFYGFHHEIGQTNMVLFAEKSKRKVLQSVYGVAKRVGKYSIMVLIVAILLLQIPLSFVTRPIRELADMAAALSEGDFSVRELKPGLGELGVLTSSFSSMAIRLRDREKSIRELNQRN